MMTTSSLISRNLSRTFCTATASARGLGNSEIKMQALESEFKMKYLGDERIVSVIGAPMTHGQPMIGTDAGPKIIRGAGLHKLLKGLHWRVEETGDLKFQASSSRDPVMDKSLGVAHNSYVVGRGNHQLATLAEAKAREGKFVLTLGGDHSIAAGSVKGILRARPETGVVWVDAHADINSPAGSSSGNMHGMPISFLMDGLVDQSTVPGWEWMKNGPYLAPEKLVYVGLRDVDDFEVRTIRRLGIKAFTMQHVDKYGIGKVMEMALDHLAAKGEVPLHLSYDIDAVDPVVAPSTGTLVRGGMTYREAHYVAEAVYETGLLTSLDMAEVNPSLVPGDGAEQTAEMALGVITSAMGASIMSL